MLKNIAALFWTTLATGSVYAAGIFSNIGGEKLVALVSLACGIFVLLQKKDKTTANKIVPIQGYLLNPASVLLQNILLAISLSGLAELILFGILSFRSPSIDNVHIGAFFSFHVRAIIFVVIGYRLGSRSEKYGIAALLATVTVAEVVVKSFEVLIILYPKHTTDIYAIISTIIRTSIIFSFFGLIGFWRGRVNRTQSYIGYIMRRLPNDENKNIILDLIYEEASKYKIDQKKEGSIIELLKNKRNITYAVTLLFLASVAILLVMPIIKDIYLSEEHDEGFRKLEFGMPLESCKNTYPDLMLLRKTDNGALYIREQDKNPSYLGEEMDYIYYEFDHNYRFTGAIIAKASNTIMGNRFPKTRSSYFHFKELLQKKYKNRPDFQYDYSNSNKGSDFVAERDFWIGKAYGISLYFLIQKDGKAITFLQISSKMTGDNSPIIARNNNDPVALSSNYVLKNVNGVILPDKLGFEHLYLNLQEGNSDDSTIKGPTQFPKDKYYVEYRRAHESTSVEDKILLYSYLIKMHTLYKANAAYHLGEIYVEKGDTQRALQMFLLAARTKFFYGDDTSKAWFAVGSCLNNMGQYKGAILAYNTSCALMGTDLCGHMEIVYSNKDLFKTIKDEMESYLVANNITYYKE